MEKIVKSKIKCKCGSSDVMLVEVWTGHTITWEQLNGEFDRNDGSMNEGDPSHLEAKCKKCKRHWRVRGSSGISDAF